MFTNPTLIRCSACGAECKRNPAGWAYALEWVAWIAFCQTVLGWTNKLPFLTSLAIGIVFVVPFQAAARRLYHAYFAWRHPTRCQGAGHAEPEPTQS